MDVLLLFVCVYLLHSVYIIYVYTYNCMYVFGMCISDLFGSMKIPGDVAVYIFFIALLCILLFNKKGKNGCETHESFFFLHYIIFVTLNLVKTTEVIYPCFSSATKIHISGKCCMVMLVECPPKFKHETSNFQVLHRSVFFFSYFPFFLFSPVEYRVDLQCSPIKYTCTNRKSKLR